MTTGFAPAHLNRPTEKALYKAIVSTKFTYNTLERQKTSTMFLKCCGCHYAVTFQKILGCASLPLARQTTPRQSQKLRSRVFAAEFPMIEFHISYLISEDKSRRRFRFASTFQTIPQRRKSYIHAKRLVDFRLGIHRSLGLKPFGLSV